jgi:hypothetical protein
MLIHIVCWKYKAEIGEDRRDEHRRRLKRLAELVPGIERLDVGADILHLDRSYDTALLAEFADLEALDAYNVHPEHQSVVAIGRELAEKVMSVDFYP